MLIETDLIVNFILKIETTRKSFRNYQEYILLETDLFKSHFKLFLCQVIPTSAD